MSQLPHTSSSASAYPPRLAQFILPYARPIAAGAAAVVAASACTMAVPLLVRQAFTALESHGDAPGTIKGIPADPAVAAALIAAFALARALFSYGARWVLMAVSCSISRDLRNVVFARLQTFPPAYYDRVRSGELLSRAVNDVEGIRMMVGMGVFQGADILSTVVFCVAGTLLICPRLTLLSLPMMVLAAILMRPLGRWIRRLSTAVQAQLSALSHRAQENFAGARTIKSYAQEANEEASFGQINREYRDQSLRLARAQGFVHALLGVLGEGAVAIILGLGGPWIVEGTFTRGDFIAFTWYQFLLVWPMVAVGWVVNLVQRGLSCWDRVASILAEPSGAEERPETPSAACASVANAPDPSVPQPAPRRERQPARSGIRAAGVAPSIGFSRLTFAYPGGPVVLADVSFRVGPGQCVAIVGNTGSGKSTLAHLLARYYAAPRGMLRIDGADINDIPTPAWREVLGYVPQEPFLFSESVRDNIRYGVPKAQEEAVVRVARLAHLMPEIERFPNGLDHVVGERGLMLSGGQRQRAALARAIAKDPLLVVLDDAFASVDADTESAIQNELRAFLHGRTTILISHRLATVRHADLIVVLERGHVAEIGTHAELRRRGGLYAAMAARQEIEEALAKA